MGLIDIFYNEFNRIRDQSNAEDSIKLLLKKILRRFVIDWEQFIDSGVINFYNRSEQFYSIYRENILDIFVEVEEFIDETIQNKLIKICDVLEKGKHTITGIGREQYNKRKEAGETAKNLANEIIGLL